MQLGSGPVLYDLVPVFWLADENCVKTRRSRIRVEREGTYTRGQTVRIGHEEGPVLELRHLEPGGMIVPFVEMMKQA